MQCSSSPGKSVAVAVAEQRAAGEVGSSRVGMPLPTSSHAPPTGLSSVQCSAELRAMLHLSQLVQPSNATPTSTYLYRSHWAQCTPFVSVQCARVAASSCPIRRHGQPVLHSAAPAAVAAAGTHADRCCRHSKCRAAHHCCSAGGCSCIQQSAFERMDPRSLLQC